MAVKAPTLIATVQSANYTAKTTPRETGELTVAKGDVLVACATGANVEGTMTMAIEGGGLTWTLRKEFITASNCPTWVWTAVATEAKTFKVKCSFGSVNVDWGVSCQQWRGSAGVGAVAGVNNKTGAPELSITTEKEHSAIAMFNSDWEEKTGAATYRTGAGAFTQSIHVEVSGQYTVYVGEHKEAGAAGAYTVGMTAPSGQKYTLIAVEVKGEEEEAGGKKLTLELTESVGISDALSKGVGKAQTESVGIADVIAKATAHQLADNVGISDAIGKAAGKPLADSVAIADQVAKATHKAEADSVPVTDQLGKQVGKALQDNVPITDSIGKRVARSLADAVAIADALARRVGKALADLIGISDLLETSAPAHLPPIDEPSGLLLFKGAGLAIAPGASLAIAGGSGQLQLGPGAGVTIDPGAGVILSPGNTSLELDPGAGLEIDG